VHRVQRFDVGAPARRLAVVERTSWTETASGIRVRICCECADLPLSALERAATVELQAAVPGGRFDPQDTP